MSFEEYAEHGWVLCSVRPKHKGPRTKGWNLEENGITDPEMASKLEAGGLCHAYSGTCAFDIDDEDLTRSWLEERGLDLDDFLHAQDAVQIKSGQPNRAKLIYSLDEPLPSTTLAEEAFELRSGTAGGKTVQDVLPPSPHPKGTSYEWVGDWKNLPPLPAELRAIWEEAVGPRPEPVTDPVTTEPSAVAIQFEGDLALIDVDKLPDDYGDWLKVGMALHFETGGSAEGLMIWDRWSAPGEKYKGFKDLASRWEGFGNVTNPTRWGSVLSLISASVDEFDVMTGLTPTSAKVNPFLAVPFTELFNRPKPTWIVDGLLPEGQVGVIYGAPGTGKTFVALDLIQRIMNGDEFLGSKVKKGKVMYIAAEDDAGVGLRLQEMFTGKPYEDLLGSVVTNAPNVTAEADRTLLTAAVREQGELSVIVVDTLSTTISGADENDAGAMSLMLDFWVKISKESGAIVILIHHSGKDTSKGMRGSSAMTGNVVVTWEITSSGQKSRKMKVIKMKNGPAGMEFEFSLRKVGTSCVVKWD